MTTRWPAPNTDDESGHQTRGSDPGTGTLPDSRSDDDVPGYLESVATGTEGASESPLTEFLILPIGSSTHDPNAFILGVLSNRLRFDSRYEIQPHHEARVTPPLVIRKDHVLVHRGTYDYVVRAAFDLAHDLEADDTPQPPQHARFLREVGTAVAVAGLEEHDPRNVEELLRDLITCWPRRSGRNNPFGDEDDEIGGSPSEGAVSTPEPS